MLIQKYVAEIRRPGVYADITCSVYPVIWMKGCWVYVEDPRREELTMMSINHIYGNIEDAINSISDATIHRAESVSGILFDKFVFVNSSKLIDASVISDLLQEKFDSVKDTSSYRQRIARKYVRCQRNLKAIHAKLIKLGCQVDENGAVLYDGKNVFEDVFKYD